MKQVRRFSRVVCVLASVAGIGLSAAAAQQSAASQSSPQVYQPSADPRAIVTFGNARFTVLTQQLIRMEWAADGKFEDHASFAFLNRRLPIPQFQSHTAGEGSDRALSLDTADLHLTYRPGSDTGRFDAQNLSITFKVGDVSGIWHPGDPDTGNLGGTTRTLDRVQGSNVKLEPGLISRDGWTLVDDSTRPLFDSADFSMSVGEQRRERET